MWRFRVRQDTTSCPNSCEYIQTQKSSALFGIRRHGISPSMPSPPPACSGTRGKPTTHVGTQLRVRHIVHLKEVILPDKLFFFDVQDGWIPLCNALGYDVPKGIDFP
ncbi:hypothetical protein F5Y06DRAFT_259302 [Hypoxylon sp. FL0890]|nr:hypothetical protein F5Y06DRAFT_259302 [Hypoxylon sp. FL0890]